MRLRYLAPFFAAVTFVGASTALGQSAVLIGLSPGPTSSEPNAQFAGYETLWVTMDGARIRTSTIPELLVPRRSGWWRAGVAIGCSGESGEELSITEVLWSRQTSDTSDVLAPEYCADSTEATQADSVEAEPVYRSYSAKDCVTNQYEITFLGPNHIAFRNRGGQTETCEPRGGRSTSHAEVRRLGSDSSASTTELLGPAGSRLVVSAVRSNEESKSCESPGDAEPGAELYITRGAGRWRPVAFFRGWMMSCEVEEEVKATVLHAITGPDALSPSWTEIRRAFASASDAFSSPSGNVVFLRVGDSLHVRAIANGEVGGRLGAINIGERNVLMIQWATGAHVARWDREIAEMLDRGLRPPRVTAQRAP